MKPQVQRIEMAKDKLKIIQQGFFLAPDQTKISIQPQQELAVANTKCYSPESSDQLIEERVFQKLPPSTQIEVNRETTLSMLPGTL